MLMQTFLWMARLIALLLAFFWLIFWIEHTQEWVLVGRDSLPIQVWVNLAFHTLMIAGLLVSLKWNGIGLAVLAVASLGFVWGLGFGSAWVLLVNFIPIAAYALYWQRAKQHLRV